MHLLLDNYVLFLAAFVVLWVCELIYFRIADRYNIIDKPNQRSSHTLPTIRGGGIIFLIGIVIAYLVDGGYTMLLIGAITVAVISFLDDIKEQKPAIRFTLHVIALFLLLREVHFFENGLVLSILAFVVVVGTVNAFNFMDGINGITGVYALVSLSTFLYIDELVVTFTNERLLIVLLAGVLVFLIFNFRKRARCFAGDVGSVTLAYVQIFFLLQLIQITENLGWVLLVLVFGIDSVITIIYRLKRRENIFQPHRTHLYQYLANELRLPHRLVASAYGLVQILINGITVVLFLKGATLYVYFATGVAYLVIYLIVRMLVMRSMTKELTGV